VRAGFAGRGAYTQERGAHAASLQLEVYTGAAHTQHVVHWDLCMAHIARGRETLPNHSKFW